MIKAVIFDKDGVIIDVEKIQHQSFLHILKQDSHTLSFDEYLRNMSGRRIDEEIHYLFGGKLSKKEREQLSREQYEFYLSVLRKKIPYVAGIKQFLPSLKKLGILVGLATSSRKESVDLIVKDLKKIVEFDAITLGVEVKQSKPNPDIFLTTAKKLGVDPKNCLVFEDSLAGVKAAKAAHMKVGFVTTSHPAGTVSGVDLTIPDFSHLTPADVL